MSEKFPFKYDPLQVAVQDQHTEIIDLHLSRILDTATLLVALILDDTSVDIETTGVVPAIGNTLCLKEDTAFYQGDILTVTPIAGNQYTVTLDTPLDFAFTVNGGCSIRSNDLAVNGAVVPVKFELTPANLSPDVEWDITRFIIHIQGSAAMDDGLFGDITSLTKGVVFRVENGIYKNLFNAKNNGDFAEHTFDREYASKAPAGKTALTIRRTVAGQEKNGVTIRLSAKGGDRLVVIVQDDLTGLDHMHVVGQGHVVE